MNTESILEKISLFNELVIDSGFKRDIKDYRQSINQAQNQNLVFMKELSEKILVAFNIFQNYSLTHELNIVLKGSKPFTELDIIDRLTTMNKDTKIAATTYLKQFVQQVDLLMKTLNENEKEIITIEEMFSKYTAEVDSNITKEELALVSLIFKDLKTTGSLREFSKVLKKWDTTLILYHRLLRSESPEQISLEAIQNGSIDVIFNIDVNVAIDLAEVMKVGLQVFGAYLAYKSDIAKKIIESYMGNKKLISLEEERQELMLLNIKESIQLKILEQHNQMLEEDSNIDKTSIKKKVDEVSSVITDHIIKGNELKLLSIIEDDDIDEDEDSEENILSTELRKETSTVRKQLKSISTEDKQQLLELYSLKT